MQVAEVKDCPRLVEPLDEAVWQHYFIEEAKKLKPEILERKP